MNTVALEARVLLEQFRKSDWREVYVRTARYALFIAKPGAGPDPMRHAAAPPAAMASSDAVSVRAPHIGTVAWIEAVGGVVTPGVIVARIEVLGAVIDIAAESAGRMSEVAAPVGTLVEFGATIATIVAHTD